MIGNRMFKSSLFRVHIPNGSQPIADDYPDDLVKPYSGASYILGLKVSMYDIDRPRVNAYTQLYSFPQPLFRARSHCTLSNTLISVLTLSITRLCFPSWGRKGCQMCEMLIQRTFASSREPARSKILTQSSILVWGFSTFVTFCMGKSLNRIWG